MPSYPTVPRLWEHELSLFREWIEQSGGVVVDCRGSYEILRFHMPNVPTCIFWANDKNGGVMKVTPEAKRLIQLWRRGHSAERVSRTSGKKKRDMVRRLLDRDGDCCFFCGEPLGDDCTVEHLLSIVHGGNNSMANLCLAHESCNQKAGDRPIVEKISERIRSMSRVS